MNKHVLRADLIESSMGCVRIGSGITFRKTGALPHFSCSVRHIPSSRADRNTHGAGSIPGTRPRPYQTVATPGSPRIGTHHIVKRLDTVEHRLIQKAGPYHWSRIH